MREPTITIFDDEGDEIELPGKWEICHRCRGNGTHTNPNIDGNGLPQEFVDDDDFMDEYMRGVYDVPCSECGGPGKIVVIDEERCNPDQIKRYEEEQQELADLRHMEAMERAAGC